MVTIKNIKGFNLLELIIVLIVVGVLSSLALVRLFRLIERSRGREATQSFFGIRSALERCYLINNKTYVPCNTFSVLSLEDPGISPNAHFTFSLQTAASSYTIIAQRNSRDSGNTSDLIEITQVSTSVVTAGTGAFLGY